MNTGKGDAKQDKNEILVSAAASSRKENLAGDHEVYKLQKVEGTTSNTSDMTNELSKVKITEPEEQDPPLTLEDIEQIKKITFEIIDEVRKGNLNNAAKILKNLSIDISSNISISDIPIIEDKPYQTSVFHLLQEEGFITEANDFGSRCQGLGYINEFYYEF